jgi:hypothetical protein
MLDVIKNVANIVFFTVVSVLTILSYIHARKTLFAPIRTETFKLQLKAFEEVLLYFQYRTESDFLDAFDLNRILSLNSLHMADAYAKAFFPEKIQIDANERKSAYLPLVGAVVSIEHAKKYFTTPGTAAAEEQKSTESKHATDPASVLSRWQEYEHWMTEYTKEYSDQLKQLQHLAASPLLPRSMRDLIGEFSSIASTNLSLIGETITDCARRMPDRFLTPADMKDYSPAWIWNDFNDRRKQFEETAKRILDYMNNYLKVEEIMR